MNDSANGQNCERCGRWILHQTAQKHFGLCVPCAKGETWHLTSILGHDSRSTMKPFIKVHADVVSPLITEEVKPKNQKLESLKEYIFGICYFLLSALAVIGIFAVVTNSFFGLFDYLFKPIFISPWFAYPIGTFTIGFAVVGHGLFAAIRWLKIKPQRILTLFLVAFIFVVTILLVFVFETISFQDTRLPIGFALDGWAPSILNLYATVTTLAAAFFASKLSLMFAKDYIWIDQYGILDAMGDAGDLYEILGGKPMIRDESNLYKDLSGGQWIPRDSLAATLAGLGSSSGGTGTGSSLDI